ncbi:unnamed protein product [Chilo suppressalis]|uniref:FP protein C-terminal domain-containing protein n=1 Tax=Chilo suppressalis TaxID=168631 RepID=A0ABN8B2F6_CHISP|nr:unnamed protein product [Chilo suppressalis]
MPVDRTPPPLSTLAQPIQHCRSESDLTTERQGEQKETHVSHRAKRKHPDDNTDSQLTSFMSEMKAMFIEFKNQQEEKFNKFEKMFSSFEEIKNQNNEIRNSIDFLSHSYDSLVEQINTLQAERRENIQYIQKLEEKIDKFESGLRSTCIELRNIPPVKKESKQSLLSTVLHTINEINLKIEPHEVKDVFRLSTRVSENRPIIVDFISVLTRDKVIEKFKIYNKNKGKLTTETLKISGPAKPIFISENLSTKMKKLFYLCRDFAKLNNFKYCWVSHGKIFLRKTDGTDHHMIKCENDLTNLQLQI